jgi:processive 1,2-diacylglycerol beta-glucosyltransferase
MKLLLLSSNNGQGHNSAAMALMQSAQSQGFEAVMIDAMLFESSKKSDFYEKVHIESALHAPKIFVTGNRLAEIIDESRFHSPEYRASSKHTQSISRFIRYNGFDTVVATHIFAAQLMTHLPSDLNGGLKKAFVVTDYTYTPFTAETELDAYFIPHKALLEKYEQNAPGKNYFPLGIPTSSKKLVRTEKNDARLALGLPSDVPIAIIMTGSMGFGDAVPLVHELLEASPEGTLVVVLCGHNERLINTLNEKYSDKSRVRAVGYTDKVGLYLDAGDVLLSKPGGLSSTEAAIKEIPLVHIDPIPGWEEDNVRFFTSLGLSLTGNTPEEMARAAASLLFDRDAADRMRQRQRQEINKNAADDVIAALQTI